MDCQDAAIPLQLNNYLSYLSYLLSMTLMMFERSHSVIKIGTSLSHLRCHDHFTEALNCLHLEIKLFCVLKEQSLFPTTLLHCSCGR